jgi:hypothetical protein
LSEVVKATEAAKKKRSARVGRVITSETVEAGKKEGKGGKGEKGSGSSSPSSASRPGSAEPAAPTGYDAYRDSRGRDEAWWRSSMASVRGRITTLETQISDLETQVAGLRNAFYNHDDPAYRDGVIKPKWDQAVQDLDSARQQLERSKNEETALRDEARTSGALPGWLR